MKLGFLYVIVKSFQILKDHMVHPLCFANIRISVTYDHLSVDRYISMRSALKSVFSNTVEMLPLF